MCNGCVRKVTSPLGRYIFYFESFMLVLNADFTDFKSAASADFAIRAGCCSALRTASGEAPLPFVILSRPGAWAERAPAVTIDRRG
jgi:hypothetical protein